MANEMVLANGKFQRPAHLTTAFEGEKSNLKMMSVRVPTLSMQARVFTIQADGKEARLTTTTTDGEVLPIASLPVVILGFNAERGRSYYAGAFDPKNIKPPECWSANSIVPAENVPDKQSDKCATCPMAVKGSRISDNNKQVSACGQFRLLSVIPHRALHSEAMPPLRLRLPVTSDYDGLNREAKAENKYAFSQYIDFVRGNGVQHSFEMVTKIMFDQTPGITYPKLWFQPMEWVSAKDAERIKVIREGEGVNLCLDTQEGEVGTQAAEAAKPSEPAGDKAPVTGTARASAPKAATKPAATKPKPEPAKVEPKPEPAAKTKAQLAREALEAAEAEEAAEAGAAAGTAVAEAAGGATADAGGDLGDLNNLGGEDPAPAPQATGKADAKAPPAASHVDSAEVDDIMAQWSGD